MEIFTLVCTFFAFNKATALAFAVPFCTVLAPGLAATFLPLAVARAFADNLDNCDCGFLPAATFFLAASLAFGLATPAFLVAKTFLVTGFLAAAAAGALVADAGFFAAAAGLAAAGLAAAGLAVPAAAVAAAAAAGAVFFSGFLSPDLAAIRKTKLLVRSRLRN